MNIRKILFIILFIIVSFYLLGLLTGPIMFFDKKSKSYLNNEVISNPISNIFLPINGSYSLAVGEGTPLNFTYIYSSDKKDLFNEIYSINLSSNEDSISIESFEVDGNAKVGKYHIKTVVLNIVAKSKGKTEIRDITIQTKNGLKKYDVGTLGINVIDDTSEKHKPLEVGGFYPNIKDEKNNYMYTLQNNGGNKIVVNKFEADLNGEQVFNIKPFVINPNKQKEVPIKVDFQKSPYAVTVLRPSIHYSDGKEQRVLLPPPTWYGLIGITEEQIEKTIEYNN